MTPPNESDSRPVVHLWVPGYVQTYCGRRAGDGLAVVPESAAPLTRRDRSPWRPCLVCAAGARVEMVRRLKARHAELVAQ